MMAVSLGRWHCRDRPQRLTACFATSHVIVTPDAKPRAHVYVALSSVAAPQGVGGQVKRIYNFSGRMKTMFLLRSSAQLSSASSLSLIDGTVSLHRVY